MYDWVGKLIHWELCKRLKFDYTIKLYRHKPVFLLKNGTYKVLWDVEIQMDHLILGRKSDQSLINKKKKDLSSNRFCCFRLKIKESGKIKKYLDLVK